LTANLLRKGLIENGVTAWSSGATLVAQRLRFNF